jgi:hypothetical protein
MNTPPVNVSGSSVHERDEELSDSQWRARTQQVYQCHSIRGKQVTMSEHFKLNSDDDEQSD